MWNISPLTALYCVIKSVSYDTAKFQFISLDTCYDIDLANKIYTIGLSKRTFDVHDRIYGVISSIAKPVSKPYK